MEKIEAEKIFIICATVIAIALFATIAESTMNTNAIEKQKYDMCINKGGTWIGTNDEICIQIQRGTF